VLQGEVKPDYIMIAKYNHVFVSDFCISKLITDSQKGPFIAMGNPV
jgi:hypothetical protein